MILVGNVHLVLLVLFVVVLVILFAHSVKYPLVKVLIGLNMLLSLQARQKLLYHLNGIHLLNLQLRYTVMLSLTLVFAPLVVVDFTALMVVLNLLHSYLLAVKFYSSLFQVHSVDGQHTTGSLVGYPKVELQFQLEKPRHIGFLMLLVLVHSGNLLVHQNPLLSIQKRDNFYSHSLVNIKSALLRILQRIQQELYLLAMLGQRDTFLIGLVQVQFLLLELPRHIGFLMLLVLVHSGNLLVQQNLSQSIQRKGNYYSPSLGNVFQRRKQYLLLDMVL